MEEVDSCSICSKLNKDRCDVIPLERISNARRQKERQVDEVIARFEAAHKDFGERQSEMDDAVKVTQDILTKAQSNLSTSLESLRRITGEANRLRSELSIITQKHHESLAHAEAMLIEEGFSEDSEEESCKEGDQEMEGEK
ncbi:hypothetical protein TWF788_008511 [Orbilia oligospora]|uniref:Uncharacterized protein n=1 Tax=Orbilia oligospora TaxID=2813651 RepID=A0A7C8PMU9_ORBOL|nr:hypothetical protein TWF788_008511 [Orbilia oligospora]